MNLHLISLLIFIIVVMGVATFKMFTEYVDMKREKESVTKLYGDEQKRVQTYRMGNGQLVTRNEALVLEANTVRELAKSKEFAYLNELKGVKKRMSNLEFVYKIAVRAMDSMRVNVKDTVKVYVDAKGDTTKFTATDWSYQDQWGQFFSNQVTPEQFTFRYSIYVPLDGAMYVKRKHPWLWIFSKKQYESEITSENPHVVIPELLNIKVGKRK